MTEHFSHKELSCKCCGKLPEQTAHYKDFLTKLEELRIQFNKPIHISSAYRCFKHNAKVGGSPESRHIDGDAVDILCSGEDALQILSLAIAQGWRGIGVSQKGLISSRFIHIDLRPTDRVIWSY